MATSVPSAHSSTTSSVNKLSSLPPTLSLRWKKNEEIVSLLQAAREHPEWLCHHPQERPQSGSVLLFEKTDSQHYKLDGYEWRRRKEARIIREDHMKLKVNKVDVISANYAHSAVVPTFHRRVYWLTNNIDLVLVHYLHVEENYEEESLAVRISSSLRRNALSLSHQQLLAQLMPILSRCMMADAINALALEVLQHINDPLLKLNRRNSCSSASRRGLSSLALARQPSAFSDCVDTHVFGGARNALSSCTRNTAHSRSPSGDTHRSSDEPAQSEWSRPDGACGSEWSMGATSLSECSVIPSNDAPLIVCPSVISMKGGEAVLVVGGWYMKGHEYTVLIGDKKVPAHLVAVGVLQVHTPPGRSSGKVQLSVFEDGVRAGTPSYISYKDDTPPSVRHLQQALMDRVHLVAAAFNTSVRMSCSWDGSGVLRALHSLRGRPLVHSHLLSSSLPSRTLFHLAAALDAMAIIDFLLFWRCEVGECRELDLSARDMEGRTPLQLALHYGNEAAAFKLGTVDATSLQELQRETERMERSALSLSSIQPPQHSSTSIPDRDNEWNNDNEPEMCVEGGERDVVHARHTATWVMSDGERYVQDEEMTHCHSHLLPQDECDVAGCMQRFAIAMDTEVDVPDSPTMANLFKAATSAGAVDGCTREQMASLARQLIHALPHTLKMSAFMCGRASSYASSPVPSMHHPRPPPQHTHSLPLHAQLDTYPVHPHSHPHPHSHSHQMMGQEGGDGMGGGGWSSFPPHHADWTAAGMDDGGRDMQVMQVYCGSEMGTSKGPSSLSPPTSHHIHFGDKELGEFFAPDPMLTDVDPIQKKLDNLKLNVVEQQEVYQAALVMQQSGMSGWSESSDDEKNAALTIQRCYRRYKQYCYLRRLHNAAVVVQKHFRLKRANGGKEEVQDEVQEHPSMQGQNICIQVPNSSLTRERAAVKIQHAYRGHRKRQAAARCIQKFMKQRINPSTDDAVVMTTSRESKRRRCGRCGSNGEGERADSGGTDRLTLAVTDRQIDRHTDTQTATHRHTWSTSPIIHVTHHPFS